MGSPLVLAHVSDLHVSTFGDTFHDRARVVRRSARIADTSPSRFDVVWEQHGWRILRDKTTRAAKLVLIDPDGYAHPLPPAREAKDIDAVTRAAAKAVRLDARRAAVLATASPDDATLAAMREATPKNSNVRLLRALRTLEASEPDLVLITGDLTDDGDGYELIEAVFARWKKAGRLLAVPGNHDLYLFPLAGSGRPRPTHASKRAAWNAFASRLGLEVEPCGAWRKEVPEAQAVVVGLDTCARTQRRFFRHNGAVGPEHIAFLRRVAEEPAWRKARHRLVALHHHVLPLPHGIGRRAPMEIGMRLDDAKEVAAVLDEVGATLVMHGHRHISEERQPAGCRFRLLAAPSLTLGCKSGDAPSFWRVELGEHAHASRVYLPLDAVEQEDDPVSEHHVTDEAADGTSTKATDREPA